MGTVTKGFDARPANRSFLVLPFWPSGAQPWSVSQPGVESLNKFSYFGNTELIGW